VAGLLIMYVLCVNSYEHLGKKPSCISSVPSQSNKMAACDDSDCRIVEDSSWSSPCSVKKARYVNSCASPSATEKPTIVIKSDLEEAEESSIQTDEVSLRKNCKKLSKTHCNRGKQVNLSGKDCLGALKNLNMKSAKWSCSQCTFLNHPLIDFCEMCSSKKEKSGREEVNCLRKVMLGDGLVGGMEANIADSALFSSEPQLNEGGSLSDQATSNGLELQLTNDGENDCLSQLMNERTSERLQAGYHTSTPTRKTDRPVLMTINDSNLTNKLAVSDSSYAGVTDETANFDLCSDWDLSQDDIGDVSQDSRSSTVAVDCRQSKNLKDMYSEETASYVFSDNRISDNTTRRDLNVSAAGQFLCIFCKYAYFLLPDRLNSYNISPVPKLCMCSVVFQCVLCYQDNKIW
jgi:hypothetical protein